MKPLAPTIFLAAAIALCAADVVDAFSGRRGTRVNPVDNVVFEVIARSAGSADDYWCGAGDFAQRALGAAWAAPIYIVRGRGQSVTTGRRSAVQFTLDPQAAGITPRDNAFWLNAMEVGDNMSVQTAQTHCLRQPVRP